jgi:quercetin dioxygenase-like cupin family protein
MSLLTLEPGAVLPLHVHVAEESFFVIEGNGTATVGDTEHPIGPETALLASAGETHGFANTADRPLRIVCMHPVGQPQTTFLGQ